MLTDMPTVQAIITLRSIHEPRTNASVSASAMPMPVSRTVRGSNTVSDGPSRLVMMPATGSPVAQELPKSKVAICLTNSHSCTGYGWSTPNCVRMLAICAASDIFPASR
jgi:hypothetical protein